MVCRKQLIQLTCLTGFYVRFCIDTKPEMAITGTRFIDKPLLFHPLIERPIACCVFIVFTTPVFIFIVKKFTLDSEMNRLQTAFANELAYTVTVCSV